MLEAERGAIFGAATQVRPHQGKHALQLAGTRSRRQGDGRCMDVLRAWWQTVVADRRELDASDRGERTGFAGD